MEQNHLDLTDENIDNEIASTDKLVLIDFWNETCIPCKRIAPMLIELASKFEHELKFFKMNADKSPKTIDRFKIRGVPTILFLKNGLIMERISGVRTRSELIEIIQKYS